MKVRNGFVSNSSSSSFVCNICGAIESGYDASIKDFDMEMCENGHEFHIGCMGDTPDFNEADTKTRYEYLKHLKEESAKKWRKNGHEDYAKVEEEYVEQLSEDFANLDEDDFIDKYDDDISDIVSEYGVPEEFCPVCRKIKQCESDPDWQKYLELKEKFKDINV